MSDINLDIIVRRATKSDLKTVVAFNAAMAKETEDKTLDIELLTKGV